MGNEQYKVLGYGFPVSPDVIRMRAEHQWIVDQTSPRGYETGRGCLKSKERGFPETYAEVLPTFAGKTIDEWVEAKIQEKGHVVLVDIGYGCGYYLLDLFGRYGKEKVTLVGYGSEKDIYKPYLNTPPTAGAFRAAGDAIRLVNGNIVDIDRNLTGIQADILCANHVFEWVQYPHWELIKKLYRIMNHNAVGFIGETEIQLVDSNSVASKDNLTRLLASNGYRFEIGMKGRRSGISFMKTSDRIALPVRTYLPGDHEGSGDSQYVVYSGGSVGKK